MAGALNKRENATKRSDNKMSDNNRLDGDGVKAGFRAGLKSSYFRGSNFRIALYSGNRCCSSFEKILRPSTNTSKRPSVKGCNCSSDTFCLNSSRIFCVRPTAAGSYFHAAQYSILISISSLL
jgi:hypothetical protein